MDNFNYDYWPSLNTGLVINSNSNGTLRFASPTFGCPQKGIQLHLAGCPKENVQVSIEDGELNIEAKWDAGDVHRRYNLGYSVDYEKIKCEYKDGLLKVVVPKKEDKRVIEVK